MRHRLTRPALVFIAAPALVVSACGAESGKVMSEPAAAETAEADPSALLDAAIAGDQRSEAEKARDAWRHPKETLTFFDVRPDMTVVEVWPGGGWYANILAPYVKSGGGVYYAAHLDPAASERAQKAVEDFKTQYGDAALYGDVRVTVFGGEPPAAPPGSADVVLTFRNVHNWMGRGTAEKAFADMYAALKPGGVLGVVEHRANEDADEAGGSTGYVKESTVKALAAAAGFEFEAASEINANPADTKDHPFGVWTLPPVRRSSAVAGETAPDFDRAKYDAIGESDRMTLRFRKPLAADGALLQ